MQRWDLSSAGRASALQAEGHRFEPCRSHSYTYVYESGRNTCYIICGEIAQLARAHGSYPWCRGFKSLSRYFFYAYLWALIVSTIVEDDIVLRYMKIYMWRWDLDLYVIIYLKNPNLHVYYFVKPTNFLYIIKVAEKSKILVNHGFFHNFYLYSAKITFCGAYFIFNLA